MNSEDTPNITPPQEDELQQEEDIKKRIAVLATVAASLGGTVAANTAIYHANDGELPSVTDTWGSTTTETRIEHKTDPQLETVTNFTVVDGEVTVSIPADWAENFADDVTVQTLERTHVDDLVLDIKNLSAEQDADTPLIITLTGHASAEDDLADAGDPEAGLSEDNPKNVETADARAEELAGLLESRLEEEGVSNYKIEIAEGSEDTLAESRITYLNELAEHFGYENTSQMIKDWNRNPENSPPQVNAALREFLGDERYVGVKISTSVTSEETESFCVIHADEVTETRETEGETKIHFFIPLVIPIRRKVKPEEESQNPEELGDDIKDPEPTEPEPEKPVDETIFVDPQPPEPDPEEGTTGGGSGNGKGGRRSGRTSRYLDRKLREMRDSRKEPVSRSRRAIRGVAAAALLGAAYFATPLELNDCFVDIEKESGSLTFEEFNFHWNSCDVPSEDGGSPVEQECDVDESIIVIDEKIKLYFLNGELVERISE